MDYAHPERLNIFRHFWLQVIAIGIIKVSNFFSSLHFHQFWQIIAIDIIKISTSFFQSIS